MNLIYLFLTLMLLAGLSIMAFPFIKNQALLSKRLSIIGLIMTLFTLNLYFTTGNKSALKQWLAQGANHYQLLVEFDHLGGLDGMIAKVKTKLKNDPHNAQGWIILGKLYHMKRDEANAATAFKQARE
jgi:cytochrome c-type biogenesis protein CcmH/NrfG